MPDKLISAADIYINPNGQTSSEDFIYPEYPIECNMSIDLPLSLIAENLTLVDTSDLNFLTTVTTLLKKFTLKQIMVFHLKLIYSLFYLMKTI